MVQHNDLSTTSFDMVLYKPIEKYLKHRGTIQYSQYSEFNATHDTGRQSIGCPYGIYTLGHFTNATVAQPSDNFSWPSNVFNLNPNRAITADVPGGTANVVMKTRVYLKTVKLTNEYINYTPVPMIMEVRWCMAKQNTIRTPYGEWIFQAKQERLGQVVANQGAPTAGYPLEAYVGEIPETFGEWNKTWKILKKETFILQGGSRVKSYNKFYYNYTADQNMMDSLAGNADGSGSNASPPSYVGGVTIVPLITCRSSVVWNDSVNKTTYAGGKWGMLSHQHYTFVPYEFETQAPYDRIYPNTYNASWVPGNEKMIGDEDIEIPNVDIDA